MKTKSFTLLIFAQLFLILTSYVQSKVNNVSEKNIKDGHQSRLEILEESLRANDFEIALLTEDYDTAMNLSKQIGNDTIIEKIVRKVYNRNNYIDILLYLTSSGSIQRRALILNAIYLEMNRTREWVKLDTYLGENLQLNIKKTLCNELKLIYTLQEAVINAPEFSYEIRQSIPQLDSYLHETTSNDVKIIIRDDSFKVVKYFDDYSFVTDKIVQLRDTKENIVLAKYELILNKTKHLNKMQCLSRIIFSGDLNVKNRIYNGVKNLFKNNSTVSKTVRSLVQRMESDYIDAALVYNLISNKNVRKRVIFELYKSSKDIDKLFELSDQVIERIDIFTVLYEKIEETGHYEPCELLKLIVKLERILDPQFESPDRQKLRQLLLSARTKLTDYLYRFIRYTLKKNQQYNIVTDSYNRFTVYKKTDVNTKYYDERILKNYGNSKQLYCYSRISFDTNIDYVGQFLRDLSDDDDDDDDDDKSL